MVEAPCRAQDAAGRDAPVVVELPVLGEQHGLPDRERDHRQRNVTVVGDADPGEDGVPVAVVERRRLRFRRVARQRHRVDVRLRGARAGRRPEQGDDQHPGHDPAPPAARPAVSHRYALVDRPLVALFVVHAPMTATSQ
jgi:hypothetical protein